ncbi:hypothetical protein A343_1345 [Porphyromonas gingivalis JCVI SC001]|nr:hypothetical protein A343_1345 [Porphyromonas gingivalis JCVI SC001]
MYGCQVNREQCPNTLPIDKHIDLVRNTFRAFLYRFADMTSLNETSSSDDFPCRAIVLCH